MAADHVSENDLLAIKWFIVVSNYEISYLGELEKNQVNMYKSQVEYEFNSGLSFWHQARVSHLDKWVKVTDNLPRIIMNLTVGEEDVECWGAGMAQWWEHSPSTNVARVRFADSTSYVGWVCCWFSSLLREVFLRVLRFSPLRKNQHF